MNTSIPVQLVEETKDYKFKPYVQYELSPYQVYFLIDKRKGHVFKMGSISYGDEFILMPLISTDCCHKIKNEKGVVKKLLEDYEIYTVPSCCASAQDNEAWESQHKAEYDLIKWIYEEVVEGILCNKRS